MNGGLSDFLVYRRQIRRLILPSSWGQFMTINAYRIVRNVYRLSTGRQHFIWPKLCSVHGGTKVSAMPLAFFQLTTSCVRIMAKEARRSAPVQRAMMLSANLTKKIANSRSSTSLEPYQRRVHDLPLRLVEAWFVSFINIPQVGLPTTTVFRN
jgi:hypothetical protein